MASSPRKPTKKPSPSKNPNARIVKRVVKNTGKKYKKGSWLLSIIAIAFLVAITSLIVACASISFLFIFNPQKVAWVNKLLPGWAQITSRSETPKTLAQIQTAITNQGQIPGETLNIKGDARNSFLLPIYKQRLNCQSDCQEIVELRLYQQTDDAEFQSNSQQYFQVATQIAIAGPEESFVAAPLVNATEETPGSSIALPLTEIRQFEGNAPSPGVWFYLRGQRQERNYNTAYGHIIYYNPQRSHLQQMQSWTSPKGELPQWQQVTRGGTYELVINQTVDLEPQVRVYQVKSVKQFLNPIELEEIVLKPPAFKNQAYEKALSIARSGLWTPAYEWLQFIKKQQKTIPAAAQAQIDLIRFHAQLSKTQANASWASPSQEILANLIDGRWGKALQVFKEAPPENIQEISTSLKADSSTLWSRVEAALQVNSKRPDVQAWGALILAAQQGEGRAYSWLKEDVKSKPDNLVEIQSLLKQLRGEVVAQSKITATQTSRIIGSVQNITQFNPAEWLLPEPKTDLNNTSNSRYQVEVSAFHDGKNWLYPPFSNINLPKVAPGKFLWATLGLDSDPVMQIAVWLPNGEQQTTAATVKAVQIKNGVLRLLIAPDSVIATLDNKNSHQPQPLALTQSALEWVQPSPITLAAMYQQNPKRAKVVLSSVWRSLQANNHVRSGITPSIEQILQKIGHWPVEEIDLTGNGIETILSISPEAMAFLNPSNTNTSGHWKKKLRPRTLIFSENSSIIYTDFGHNSQQSLTAIANMKLTPSPSLLIESGNQYTIKRWSQKAQRFE
jgi:hypothetical protein